MAPRARADLIVTLRSPRLLNARAAPAYARSLRVPSPARPHVPRTCTPIRTCTRTRTRTRPLRRTPSAPHVPPAVPCRATAPCTYTMTASPSSPSSPPASPRPDPLDLARPALEANADMAAARDADIALVLRGVRVRIQKRPPAPDAPATEEQFETAELKELRLPLDPTLDDIRAALVGCELGDP
eukprot:IDg16610t1